MDRFLISQGLSAGRCSVEQSSDTPDGFSKSLKISTTTADTSIGASEYHRLQTKFEGQNLQRFAKGTTGAKEFTLSFYCKANAAATYVVELYDLDNQRTVAKTFSVTTDWTRVILTFPADTTGAFDYDNLQSMQLNWWMHTGSTYGGGTLQTTWGGIVQANRAAGIDSIFDSTSRTFFITGVQLEVGPQATPFEHRSFADELARCERYFQTYSKRNWQGTNEHAGNYKMYVDGVFRQKMRAAPSATFVGTVTIARPQVGVTQRPDSIGGLSTEGFQDCGWPSSGTYGGSLGTHGDAYYRMAVGDGPTNRIDFDAEL